MAFLLTLALLVRLGWGLSRPVDEASLQQLPDQREYLELAQTLLSDRVLALRDPRMEVVVRAFRMPGYPAFLAACGAEPRIARSAQAILDTSTVLAAFLLARRWLTPGLSLIAAALVAINPFLVYFSGLLLSETLFTAMLAWSLVLMTVRQSPLERWRSGVTWAAGVALLALAIHVRPSAIAMPIVLGLAAVLVNRDPHHSPRRRWPFPLGATAILLTLAALTPWAFRNYHVLGTWIWTTTNSGFTAYDGFNPDATGGSDQRFVADMPHLANMTESERSTYLSEQARAFIRAHPQRAIELAGAKIARTWSPVPLSEEFSRPSYVAIALAFALPFDVLVLIGLCRSNRPKVETGISGAFDSISSRNRLPLAAKLLLMLPAVYLTVVHAMSVGSLRYRIPAEVPMAVVAASAFGIVHRGKPSFSEMAAANESLN